MNDPHLASRRLRWSRLVAGALVVALGACAAQPQQQQAAEAALTAKGDRAAASELYAGQPAVVHATEYPVESYADGMKRGDEAWRQGKLDLAVYLYVQSLVFDATRPEPFVRIGYIHEQLGNAALAVKAYEFALDRAPDNAAVCERLGLLYLQADRNDAAQRLLEHAVALEPKRAQAHNGLGVLADRRGDHAAAIGHYDAALALDPKAAMVLNNRGYSRFLAGDPQGAVVDLRQAILSGASHGAWLNLGRVEAAQGHYAEALECFVHETDRANAYNLLGEAAFRNEDYARAHRYFEAAIDAAPRYFEAAQRNLALATERLAAIEPAPVALAPDAGPLPTVSVERAASPPVITRPASVPEPAAVATHPTVDAAPTPTVVLPRQAPIAAVARPPARTPAQAPPAAVARTPAASPLPTATTDPPVSTGQPIGTQ